MPMGNGQQSIECLYSSGAKIPTSSTTKAVLTSVLIPAGMMGPNSSMEIEVCYSFTASTNNKTVAVEIGPNIGSVTSIFSRTGNNGTATHHEPKIVVSNRADIGAQVLPYSLLSNYGTNGTGVLETKAINFAVDQTVFFVATLAVGTEVVNLEHAAVIIRKPRQ